MKNVLVLASTFPRWKNDSTPSFVFNLSNLLAKKYRIAVLAPHAYKAEKRERLGNLSVHRFKYFFPEKYQSIAYGAGILPNVKRSFLAKLQIPSFLFSQINNADKIVKKEKINLIHAHWLIPQGVIGALLKRKHKIPMIVTIHGSDLFPLKNKFFKKLQRFVVDNADFITINSKITEKELLSRSPNAKSKTKIIPMGVDTSIFKPKNIKNKFQKYKNNKIILFAGRLNEQKGVEYLIRAMPQAISKINNAKLLIIGDGEYRKYLEKLTAELKLEYFVEFLGFKAHNELADYYNLADVFALPSVTSKIGTEAFGLVLIEAMASGTCVIGSSSGGIRNIVADGKNGLIFQEKNPEELANRVIKVLTDEKLRKKLSRNGLKYARQHYDWKTISNQFLKIYEKLLK